MDGAFRQRMGALLLVLPLASFTLFFFLWPLGLMVKQSFSDSVVSRVLPATSSAVAGWDKASPPSQEMTQAVVRDLAASSEPQVMGDAVRRLNSGQPGFRTLLTKTIAAVAEGKTDLLGIDERWSDARFWITIAEAVPTVTDRYFLAAVDLQRSRDGAIEQATAASSSNRLVFARTLWIASVVTLVCFLLGYPYALLMASVSGWRRNVLLVAVMIPIWTSLLVRTAAWFILLQENGLINNVLRAVRLIDQPLALIFNRSGVLIAMTHVLLPMMVLPIYGVLITISNSLALAAGSLGATPLRSFYHVTLPLSRRGIASGMLLVFMSAIGYYITPALIGGAQDQMISSTIAFYATQSSNWGMASALGIVLLVVTIAFYSVYGQLSQSRRLT